MDWRSVDNRLYQSGIYELLTLNSTKVFAFTKKRLTFSHGRPTFFHGRPTFFHGRPTFFHGAASYFCVMSQDFPIRITPSPVSFFGNRGIMTIYHDESNPSPNRTVTQVVILIVKGCAALQRRLLWLLLFFYFKKDWLIKIKVLLLHP